MKENNEIKEKEFQETKQKINETRKIVPEGTREKKKIEEGKKKDIK
jgi:hypothetical protein